MRSYGGHDDADIILLIAELVLAGPAEFPRTRWAPSHLLDDDVVTVAVRNSRAAKRRAFYRDGGRLELLKGNRGADYGASMQAQRDREPPQRLHIGCRLR